MIIKNVYNMYFSPTGGTQKATEFIADAWETWEDIDLSVYGADYSRYRFGAQDLCIIGVPAYGGRVPEPALAHLGQMKAEGTPAVLVVSFGNRAYDDTILELKEAAERAGFLCMAAVAAVTEHSIVRKYGAGRPDSADAEELKGFSRKLKKRLDEQKSVESVVVPGNHPYRKYNGVPIKPKASGKCTACGVCAKRCPVSAIPLANPVITDKRTCISCMRCIQVCPVQARRCSPILMAAVSGKLKKVCAGRKKNELFL